MRRKHSRESLLFLAILLGLSACRGTPGPATPEQAEVQAPTELEGSWFVRYRTVVTPFLDVAFAGVVQPSKVVVDLQGPERLFEGIELQWNAQESEWQHPISWLPDPLPAGLWWVAAVRADLSSGTALNYSSTHPSRPYVLRRMEGGQGRGDIPVPTEVWPGAFTSSPVSENLLYIETSPVEGLAKGDPILHAFESGDLKTWFAVNDDSEVDSSYPVLAIDPGARTEFLVRVSDPEDDLVSYRLRVFRGARPSQFKEQGSRTEDVFEIGETASGAQVIRPGEARLRHLHVKGDGGADDDWFRVLLVD